MLEEILDNNCSPALLYFVFTLIYTSIDLYNTKYTEAGVKLIIMIIMIVILNILCDRGQKILAYLVVFLPLMFMFHLSGLILYIFNEKPNVLDSDLVSDSDTLTTTVTKENDIKNPGKVIAGQTGYITNQFFKCDDFCKPSSECSYVCHQKGCYKETDEPNNCWEKYKDATKNIDLEEIPGAKRIVISEDFKINNKSCSRIGINNGERWEEKVKNAHYMALGDCFQYFNPTILDFIESKI